MLNKKSHFFPHNPVHMSGTWACSPESWTLAYSATSTVWPLTTTSLRQPTNPRLNETSKCFISSPIRRVSKKPGHSTVRTEPRLNRSKCRFAVKTSVFPHPRAADQTTGGAGRWWRPRADLVDEGSAREGSSPPTYSGPSSCSLNALPEKNQ